MTRIKFGAGITSGTASCVARVGTKTLRSSGTVGTGRASCTLRMPGDVGGKRVAGTITVTVLGHATTTPFTFKVS